MTAYTGDQIRRSSAGGGRYRIDWARNWQGDATRDFSRRASADCPWQGYLPDGFSGALLGAATWPDGTDAAGTSYTQAVAMAAAGEFYLAAVVGFTGAKFPALPLWGASSSDYVSISTSTGQITVRIADVSQALSVASVAVGNTLLEVWRDAANAIHIRQDGVELAHAGSPMAGTFGGSGWGYAGGVLFDEILGEAVYVAGASTAAERDSIRSYLGAAWGTIAEAPSTQAEYEVDRPRWWPTPAAALAWGDPDESLLDEPTESAADMAAFALALWSWFQVGDQSDAELTEWVSRAAHYAAFVGHTAAAAWAPAADGSPTAGTGFWPLGRVAVLGRHLTDAERAWDGSSGPQASGLWDPAADFGAAAAPLCAAALIAYRLLGSAAEATVRALAITAANAPLCSTLNPNPAGVGEAAATGQPTDSWLLASAAYTIASGAPQIHPLTVALAGAGGLAATLNREYSIAATFAGEGELERIPAVTQSQLVDLVVAFGGAGGLAATPNRSLSLAAAMAGSGGFVAAHATAASKIYPLTVALAGAGKLTAATRRIHSIRASMLGVGGLQRGYVAGPAPRILWLKQTFAGWTSLTCEPVIRQPRGMTVEFVGGSDLFSVHRVDPEQEGLIYTLQQLVPEPVRATRQQERNLQLIRRTGRPAQYLPGGDVERAISIYAKIEYSGIFWSDGEYHLAEGVTCMVARHPDSILEARVNDRIVIEVQPGQYTQKCRVKKVLGKDEGMFLLEVEN